MTRVRPVEVSFSHTHPHTHTPAAVFKPASDVEQTHTKTHTHTHTHRPAAVFKPASDVVPHVIWLKRVEQQVSRFDEFSRLLVLS